MSIYNCAKCSFTSKVCREQDGKAPAWCPTLNRPALTERAQREYEVAETRELARLASVQEGEGYTHRHRPGAISHPIKCRLEETLEFCRRVGARRVGLAFCVGLAQETAFVSALLEQRGLEVVGVSCKVGGVPKEEIGVTDAEKVHVGQHETMCNPILQAIHLNEAATDLNIMLGLCVGHDALFLKHAQSPTTVLAVKDRVTGHNPLAALYTTRSFYQRLGAAPAPPDGKPESGS